MNSLEFEVIEDLGEINRNNDMLRKMQIWHLAALFLIPVLYSVFRMTSEPSDRWRQYIDVCIILIGSVWASFILLQTIISGQHDGWKVNVLKVYRNLLSKVRFLSISNLILTIIALALLFQLLMYRQVEFYTNKDVDLYLNDTLKENDKLGSLKRDEVTKVRLLIGNRHLVFRARNNGKVVSSTLLSVEPIWLHPQNIEFKIEIEEKEFDETLN